MSRACIVLVLAAAAVTPSHAQPTRWPLIPIGQLDGSAMRQMMATTCGPYLTLTVTDATGGGLLHLALSQEGGARVVTVPLGAVRIRWCDKCQPPEVVISGDDAAIQVELEMSQSDWKMSPCLRNTKRGK